MSYYYTSSFLDHQALDPEGGAIVQLLSHVLLFATPWTAARQASLPLTISRSLLTLMSTELVTLRNHVIVCRLLVFPPSLRRLRTPVLNHDATVGKCAP